MKTHAKKLWRIFYWGGKVLFVLGLLLVIFAEQSSVLRLMGDALFCAGWLLNELGRNMPALEQAGKMGKVKFFCLSHLIFLAMVLTGCFLVKGRYVLMGGALLLSIVTTVIVRWNEPYDL